MEYYAFRFDDVTMPFFVLGCIEYINKLFTYSNNYLLRPW